MDAGSDAIARAVDLLLAGNLVGLPTETVYGLAADANNPEAVAKIFAAKGRPADHPLIVHLGADYLLSNYAREIPDDAWALAESFWPGPLTLILKKAASVPDCVTGGQDTVSIRIPAHPIALTLLRAFADRNPSRGGVAAPSANKFGRISPTRADHVAQELGDEVSLILDGGDCLVGIESTIVDLSRGEPVILRPGAITAAQIELVLGKPVVVANVEQNLRPGTPRVSGSLASHYAPRTPLSVLSLEAIKEKLAAGYCAGVVLDSPLLPEMMRQHADVEVLANQPASFAHDFYRVLRDLDERNYRNIYVQQLPETPDWFAVRDRLGRAAHRD
ncbi:MAG: Threonylcarbamoyl-AMP synthase [Fluviibacter phosphoraccumulans EoVTN8]